MRKPNLMGCKQELNSPECKMRNEEGFCIALDNTNFTKQCPFYKKGSFSKFRQEYKEDLKAYKEIHGGD